MTVEFNKLGPGTLELGETGTAVDYACQITGATLAPDASKDDDVPTLCGDVLPGATTYAWTLAGTAVQDLADPAGLVKFTWDNKGELIPFSYTPSTEADASFAGTVVMNPLGVGGDTAGENMTSDFEWSLVGDPVPTWPTGGAGTLSAADVDDDRELIDA